jgi:Ca-activated chloride channel family protein
MTFMWPILFVLLAILPVAVIAYVRIQRRRRQAAKALGGLLAQRPAAEKKAPGVLRSLPALLFLVGLALLLFALARPQAMISLPRVEGTIILAFDVSGSMAADDMQPTRMEAAKAAATAFVERQPASVLLGVVAFSDNGLAVQVPTYDHDAVLAAIARLTPQRGTSLAQGIQASLGAISAGTRQQGPLEYSLRTPQPTATPTPVPEGTFSPAAIILLTDGENNMNPDPLTLAKMALERGVRIYTVGIGSAEGTVVHVNGISARTQLNEDMLQQISALTKAEYYNAQTQEDLQAVYQNLNPQLVVRPERTELTAVFAGASIIIMLAGGLLSLGWFGRVP